MSESILNIWLMKKDVSPVQSHGRYDFVRGPNLDLACPQLWGDLALGHGIELAARWHSRHQPVYRYFFTNNAYNMLTQFIATPQNVPGAF